jgi:glycosyltransferase involved in cell wall biosynthesis
MRALVIAPQPFFSPRGTPFSVYYRTLITSELGVDIDLLTYGEGQDVDISGVRIYRIPRFKFLGPVKVGPSILKLFLDMFIVLWTIGLLCRRRYHFVHAHEEAVFFCRFLKPIFRFKLIYDMHSSLPQQLTNFKFTTSKMLIGLFERLENSCLRAADAVITICPDLADYAVPRVPDPQRHVLIENSIFETVRLKNVADTPVETSRPDIPTNRPIVSYAGTFESYQGLDILIPAFARAREKCPDAFLLLIGGNPQQVDHFRTLAAENGIEADSLLTGRLDQATTKALLADVQVLTSPRSAGTNTPLKVYEQLASGVPLVATRIYSHTQVLNDDVCYLVEPTPESMAEGLVDALLDTPRRTAIIESAKALYRDAYSRPVYVQKMTRLLEGLR